MSSQTLTLTLAAADGATETLTVPYPAIMAAGNPYPNPGIWTGGTITNNYTQITQLNLLYINDTTKAPAVVSPYLTAATTPYGAGFSFQVPDSQVAVWSSSDKTVLLRGPSGASAPDTLGTVAQWTFPLYLPSQTFPNVFFAGLLWELHTLANQAHSIQLDTTQHGTPSAPWWKFYYQDDSGGSNVQTAYAGPVTLNAWHQVCLQVYWTETTGGYMRWYVDGKLLANFSGQTYWASFGNPYLQFGYYAQLGGGLTNYANYGPVVRTQFAALGS